MMQNIVRLSTKSPRNDHRWTDDELKHLMAKWMRGDELEAIAAEFGISARGVNRQIQRMRANGIPIPRRVRGHRSGRSNKLWTPEEVEYLVRRRNERASVEEIANELDRTFLAVQGMIEKLKQEGVLVRQFGRGMRRLWDPERLKVAIAARGLSDSAAREELNASEMVLK